MSEEWRAIAGHERYEVSSLGRVRNVQTGTVRAQTIGRSRGDKGYCRVDWNVDGQKYHFRVHHLVLEAFRGPRSPGEQARHLDDNPSNNTLQNLVWGSLMANMRDKVRNKNRWDTQLACKFGHSLTGSNLKITKKNFRACRECALHKGRARQGYYLGHAEAWPEWAGEKPPEDELLFIFRRAMKREAPRQPPSRVYVTGPFQESSC